MKRVRAWLLGCALTLLGTPALADLQLELQASGLDPQQTWAGFTGPLRGHARSHRYTTAFETCETPVGAGGPAKGPVQAT
ncbi:hypothetical protein T1E_0569 [Pseudomonas putida DOT-T1E]|uniref:Uncharacterized protein n=1 Tax=Pseudomonas putida (strain DOT-T1E) TaxID=1196325 RepID=I7BQN0_PSEPT|nr:hypothetical protein T1E_0569 [Pseudomonas putida DOT-T1E]